MVKYKQYIKNLIEKEKDLFESFKKAHFEYEQGKNEDEFHKVGSEVVKKLKQTEDKLCLQTETGQYNKYSNQLSDKFWDEVRRLYPKIDEVKVAPVVTGVSVDDLF